MSNILEIKNLYKYFGGIRAIDNLSMQVRENSLTALIGPNGCGKSTLFNVISGVLKADSGSIKFNGTELIGLQPNEINHLGLSRTFQDTKLFQNLTVVENMMLPPKHQKGEKLINIFKSKEKVDEMETELLDKALDILDLLEIRHMGYEYTKNLSGGQSKLVDLARILMSDPKMLLLDEPTAGVNPALTEKLFQKIFEMKNKLNLTVMIIEHDMDVIMRDEVDYVFVSNLGNIVAQGIPKEVQKNKDVIEAYLGK